MVEQVAGQPISLSMSLRSAAAHAFSAHVNEARTVALSAVHAGARAGADAVRMVQWRNLPMPVLPSATPGQRTGLAVAAVSGVTVATIATVVVARRRRSLPDTPDGETTRGDLPTHADYPGPDRRWDRVTLGVLADGAPADIRLGYSPHILLVGPTGSGKSVVGRNIVLHCLVHADDWTVVGIDLKQVELSYLRDYDHATVATTLDEAVIALAGVSTEMDRRYRAMEDVGVNHFRDLPAPPKATLVYLDEAAMLSPRGATTEAEEAENFLRSEAIRMLHTIARLGRAAGIHLVLATQRPDATILAGGLGGNLDARIVMGQHGAHASELALGNDAAAHLPKVRGRGVLSTFGHTEQFQSYYAPQDWYDEHLAAQASREQSPFHPVPLLRTPSGVVVCTDDTAHGTVAAAVARLDARTEIRAVTAATPSDIKQAIRRDADVIGYVGNLDDPKALDRIVWAGTVGCVVYVAAPGHTYDDITERLTRKADQRQVGCQIVPDA